MTTFDISNRHYCLSSQTVCADDSKHHNDYKSVRAKGTVGELRPQEIQKDGWKEHTKALIVTNIVSYFCA